MVEHKKEISVLFVGLGSIGARHLRNLSKTCEELGVKPKVTALRSSQTPLEEPLAKLVPSEVLSLSQAERFDVAFITNPTNLHAETIEQLAGRVGTFFIEKPIFDLPHQSLEQLGLGPAQKAYVAAPMRFTALYAALKKQLEGVQPYCARCICSSYLPDWRSGVDYRQVYSASSKQGGGVALDLIHEWDYITDLFGMPQKSVMLRGKYSHLEIDSDDLAVYIAQYPQMICELHLDYFGREYRRSIELFCKEGSLLADFGSGELVLPNGEVQSYSEDANRRYEREMESFLAYALGQSDTCVNTPQNAQSVLRLALGESTV